MAKKIKNSSNDSKHPYLLTSKWADGTLAFWRKSPSMYSKDAIEYYEQSLKQWKKDKI